MEAIIVDPRKTTPEEMERGMRDVKLVFTINQTMPYTEEYNNLVKELFGDNLGDGSMVMPLLKGVCFDRVKIAKRMNHLQAQRAAATSWRKRRARINTISPGVVVTPLAYDEFNANGEGYQRMIDASAAQRTGTSDEIAEVAAFLLGEHAKFITGTELLIDGGVIAAIRTGEYQLG